MSKIPKLRFKEFSGDWEEKKLSELAKITMGQSPDSNSYNFENIGIPLIQGNADCKDRKTLPRTYTSQKTKECFIDDIIMTVRAPVGAISKSLHHACIGRGVCSIKPKNNNDFVYQFLIKFEGSWAKYSQGSTFTAVNSNDVKSLKLNIPSKDEQEKIASFLTSVDTKIEKLIKKETLLQEYKKGVMQKIFNQEIRFKADDGSEFCDWKENEINSFVNLTLREVPKPNSNYLAIGVRSHCKGTFQKPDSEPHKIAMDKLYQVRENDLIVSITFAWESAIAIVKQEDENGLVSHRFPTYTFKENVAIVDFFRYVIIQKKFRFMLDLISPGGAGRNRVMSKKNFLKLKWNIPCVEEQKKIANFLSEIDTKIKQTQKQLEQTKEFKKALLQTMFV